MGYRENKERSRTPTIGPSMADQAGADATDINIIMKKMEVSGQLPQSARQPIYADFSEIPDNLRDMIEMGREMNKHRAELPTELQGLSNAELLNSSPEQIVKLMTEEKRYNERHTKLPKHLQSLSRSDVLNLTDEQYNSMVNPPQPAVIPPTTTK